MSTSLSIREAGPADDVAVGELLVGAFVAGYARKLPDVVVSDSRKSDLRAVAEKRKVAQVWVAVDGGRVVGTVAIWLPGKPGSEAWLPQRADLRHLAVADSHQGQGVAKALLDVAEQWARAQGCVGVCLHVRREALGVRRLYESRGYVAQPEGDRDLLPDVYLSALALEFEPVTSPKAR